MSGRLNASLCLPQGTLKSTTGVCLLVFFPSIHTSDHGIELIVIEQSPPPPESSAAATVLRAAGASSEAASPPVSSVAGASRTRLRFGVGGADAIPPPDGDEPVPGGGLAGLGGL